MAYSQPRPTNDHIHGLWAYTRRLRSYYPWLLDLFMHVPFQLPGEIQYCDHFSLSIHITMSVLSRYLFTPKWSEARELKAQHNWIWSLNSYSAGIDFSRQNLTSVDVRLWRLKSIHGKGTLSPCALNSSGAYDWCVKFAWMQDFSRQNLTSVDVRFWRLKSIPVRIKIFLMAVNPYHRYSNGSERAK